MPAQNTPTAGNAKVLVSTICQIVDYLASFLARWAHSAGLRSLRVAFNLNLHKCRKSKGYGSF